MIFKFWDEDSNIKFWAFALLITMPIWGPIVLLIQDAPRFLSWLLKYQTIIYIVIGAIIGIVTTVSSVISFRSFDKSVPLVERIILVVLPCIGTFFLTIALFIFMDIQSLAYSADSFWLFLSLLVWLVTSFVGIGIVIFLQISAASCTSDCYSDGKKAGAYGFALLPIGGVLAYLALSLFF